MKKLLVLIAGMCFCLQSTNVQAQVARHYWLNPQSVNYTLSNPLTTSPSGNGVWMLAVARNEEGANLKNTIAVFELDNAYNIVSTAGQSDVQTIGFPSTTAGYQFDPDVNFEVHCIVQSVAPDSNYVICGSMQQRNGQQNGMVIVLDAWLNVLSVQEWIVVRVNWHG